MKFQEFRKYFSAARVNRYLAATGGSKTKAAKLYKSNLKLAQSFHPLLGVLEVILRNRINDILTVYFTDPDWIINQKRGFMIHPTLTYTHKRTGRTRTNRFILKEVEKAESRIRKTGAVITSGKIIAEQTMGFWTDLFELYHYRILAGKPIQIFKSLPSGYGRKDVSDALNLVRRFRNRINHNEPICFNGANIDFTEVQKVQVSIINLLSWVDPELIKYIKDIDRVDKVISSAKKI